MLRVVLRVEAVVWHARRVAVVEVVCIAVRVVDAYRGVAQRGGDHVPVGDVGHSWEIGRVHTVGTGRVVERDAHVGLQRVVVEQGHVLGDVELRGGGAVVARHRLAVAVHPDGVAGGIVLGQQVVDRAVVQVRVGGLSCHGLTHGHLEDRVVVVQRLLGVALLPRTAPLRVVARGLVGSFHPVVQHNHQLLVGIGAGGDIVVGGGDLCVAVLVEVRQLRDAVGAATRCSSARRVVVTCGVVACVAAADRAVVHSSEPVEVRRGCGVLESHVAVLHRAGVGADQTADVARDRADFRVGVAVPDAVARCRLSGDAAHVGGHAR